MEVAAVARAHDLHNVERMKRAILAAAAIGILLASVAGCSDGSRKTAAKPDSAIEGPPDVSTDPDGGPETSGPGEAGPGDAVATPTSPTFCSIVATLVQRPDARAGSIDLPATHRFSLLVDWQGNTATTGAGGTASKVALIPANGEWTTQDALTLSLSLAFDWSNGGTASSGRPFVSYEHIVIRPTVAGCAGHATGKYLWQGSDVLYDVPFDAELAGTADQAGPTLSIVPTATSDIHPLDFRGVSSNELLPAPTSARWVATDGASVSLGPLPANNGFGVSGFTGSSLAQMALAFGSSYRLELSPSAVDLAGNPAAQLPSLQTLSGPGLFAQDGFEGPVDALLGGQVKLVDASAFPIPAGQQAIRFAPVGYGTSAETSCQDRFTARLAVGPAAKAVKLSVLSYSSGMATAGPFNGWLRLAVPNGAVADLGSYWILSKDAKPLPSPWSGALPGSSSNKYGALSQLEFALPPGTGAEVIVDLYRPCTEPMLTGEGVVLDDLRVE